MHIRVTQHATALSILSINNTDIYVRRCNC